MVKSKSLSNRRSTGTHSNVIKNITLWKQIIIDTIISDDELAKLLYHNSKNATSLPNLTDEEKGKLHGTNVFGYRYNPTIQDQADQIITVGMSKFAKQEGWKSISSTFIAGYIFIYILVNNKNMDMENGYRQDLIADRVHSLFHGNPEIGIGKLEFDNMIENWEHNNKFGGYVMGFRVVDYA